MNDDDREDNDLIDPNDEEDWPGEDDEWYENDQVVVVPIEDEIDLHTYPPREVKLVLEDYLLACREAGILEVRVIHGKGTGRLQATVHSYLKKDQGVLSFHLAPGERGGWGATIVFLKPL